MLCDVCDLWHTWFLCHMFGVGVVVSEVCVQVCMCGVSVVYAKCVWCVCVCFLWDIYGVYVMCGCGHIEYVQPVPKLSFCVVYMSGVCCFVWHMCISVRFFWCVFVCVVCGMCDICVCGVCLL